MNARRYIVLLNKMSVKKLSTIILLITFILLTGVTEEEAIELYMNKLQTFSVHIISLEEKGCFSHNFIEKKIVRSILRIKMLIEPIFRKYTYRNNINYYRK